MKFILVCLATWRLTSLMVNERGPFDIFYHIRRLVGIVHDDDKLPMGAGGGFFSGLLECFWCTSVWMAALASLAYLNELHTYPLAVLAASAVAIFVEEKWLGQ